MSEKYCPLQDWNPNKAPKDMKCKGEKCAWWLHVEEQCGIVSIAVHQRLATVRNEGYEY